MPQVSVIIATHNRAGLIGEAIDSVLAQTFADYEILVVDDGSTDDTRQVLEKYGDKIKYFYQPNKWQAAALNRGVREARGKYIAFLDDDDLWLPHKLEVQVRYLDDRPAVGFVCSEALLIDIQGAVVGHLRKRSSSRETFESLYEQHYSDIVFPSVVVRKAVLEEVGGLDETLKCTQDFDLYLRLAQRRGFAYLHIPLVKYRQHSQTKTNDKVQKCRDRLRVITKPQYMAHLSDRDRRIRIAKEYYFFGSVFRRIGNYLWAAKCYGGAVRRYPLVGAAYRAQGGPSSRWQLLYHALKAYALVAHCSYKALRTAGRGTRAQGGEGDARNHGAQIGARS